MTNEHRIFVGNLSLNTSKETLVNFAGTHGKVLNTILHKKLRKPSCYGFITFETEQEVSNAVKELNKKELEGHEVNVEVAHLKIPTKKSNKKEKARNPIETDEKTDKKTNDKTARKTSTSKKKRRLRKFDPERSPMVLFVANLPFTTKEEDLKVLFEDYKVVSAHVVRTEKGLSRGYGFVDFETEEEKNRALDNVKDVVLDERPIHIRPSHISKPSNEPVEESEFEEKKTGLTKETKEVTKKSKEKSEEELKKEEEAKEKLEGRIKVETTKEDQANIKKNRKIHKK